MTSDSMSRSFGFVVSLADLGRLAACCAVQ